MNNTFKLKALMLEHGYNNESIAKYLKISKQSFSMKINNHREFKISEIIMLATLFNLTNNEIVTIFFNNCVDLKSTQM